MKTALSIAGSDPSGGAGIQADLKTMTMHGVYAMSAVTALTAQNTTGVRGVLECSPEFLALQLDCVFSDIVPDAVKTGMVASAPLIRVIANRLTHYQVQNLVVDPVMGDYGRVYQTYTAAMCSGMARLAELADVITPNLTEAALLLGQPYETLPAGEAGLREITERLSLGGRRSVVLTGASLAPGRTGAVCFDARTGKTEAVQTAYVAHEFHGTGDVFSSVLTGALVRGESLSSAAGEAAAFVRACAERTAAEDLPMREGVDFEPLLGLLIPGKETV